MKSINYANEKQNINNCCLTNFTRDSFNQHMCKSCYMFLCLSIFMLLILPKCKKWLKGTRCLVGSVELTLEKRLLSFVIKCICCRCCKSRIQ